ncbi:MAG: SCO family protein [Chitinophagales bacterium]|nr:SCO family protein [Chitinophagales bacterium]
MKELFYFLAIFSFFLFSCQEERSLPIYGKEAVKTDLGYDTIVKKVANFQFVDQKGESISNADFEGKVFVSDFFFTSCPSICPVMSRQMLRIYTTYLDNEELALISHTIDPDRDDVQKLDEYAHKLGIEDNKKWHFVTGEKEDLYKMAENYMIIAYADDEVPGGFEHSGYFILVDQKQQVRGYYDGTDEAAVSQLILDIQVLLDGH